MPEGACVDRLDLVDAAFDRPGGPAAKQLAENYCPKCPIWHECLITALDAGEHGVWGGLNERERRRRVRRSPAYNLRTSHPRMVDGHQPDQPTIHYARAVDRRQDRLAELGVTSAVVRQWANSHDVPIPLRGLPPLVVLDAYAHANA